MLTAVGLLAGLAGVSPANSEDQSSPDLSAARAKDAAVWGGLNLTHPQRRWVYDRIEHSGVVGPDGFSPTIGMRVPDEIELQSLPPSVTELMPALNAYLYAKVNLKVLLVDPDGRRLEDIIENPLL